MDNTTLTLREAAFVFKDKLKNIVRIIEEHSDLNRTIVNGNRVFRILDMADLMYIQLLEDVGNTLTPKGRKEWHHALVENWGESIASVGILSLSLSELQESVKERLNTLTALKDSVEGDPEDPLIKGTDIEVYRISAILDGGATADEIIFDFPSLNHEQIEKAGEYARVIPKMGRPYPSRSFKSAINGINLSLLDELADDETGERT